MAPTDSALVAQLKKSVKSIFASDREQLTVKKVRTAAEEELDLDTGFFLSPEWKDKSKNIIKDHVEYLDRLEEAGEAPAAEPTPEKKKKPVPAPKKAAPPKKRAQKPTAAEKVRPTKRQKKQATPSDEDDVSASSALSDVPSADSENFEDSDASAAPKPKKKTVLKSKTLVKRGGKKSKPDVSEDSAGDSESDAPPTKKQTPIKKSKAISKPTKSNTKIEKSGSDNESSVLTTQSESEGAPAKTKKASPEPPKPTKMKQPVVKPKFLESDDKSVAKDKETVDDEEKANASDSSEMSVLIDEAPKPKRKKSSKSSEPSKTKTKASKPKAPPKTTTPLSPTEEQIKTLQTQLLKCGIRKIWAFELKQYGDDAKAKIKHLSNMLKDAGMVGRFSESRAREIKELRELQKDLEDVKEGEKSWGMESGRRSRSAAGKNLKISSDDDDGDDDSGEKGKGDGAGGDDEDEDDEQPAARKRRVQNDLAFLGSESESD